MSTRKAPPPPTTAAATVTIEAGGKTIAKFKPAEPAAEPEEAPGSPTARTLRRLEETEGFLADCDFALADAVQAVLDGGKAAHVIIDLTLARPETGKGVAVTGKVTARLPGRETDEVIFYPATDTILQTTDPQQPELFKEPE